MTPGPEELVPSYGLHHTYGVYTHTHTHTHIYMHIHSCRHTGRERKRGSEIVREGREGGGEGERGRGREGKRKKL